MKINLLVAAALTCCILAFTGVAGADTPSEDTYGGVANQQQSAVTPDTDTAAATQTASSATLPFTGFELGIALAAGAALVGTGFMLRRVSRSSTT